MEIVIGKYVIRSDAYNMWIEEEKTTKKGDVKYERVTGYSQNIDQLLIRWMDKRLRNSDAKSVKEFLQEANAVREDVINVVGGIKNGN